MSCCGQGSADTIAAGLPGRTLLSRSISTQQALPGRERLIQQAITYTEVATGWLVIISKADTVTTTADGASWTL